MIKNNLPKTWKFVSLNQVAEKPKYGYTASASNEGNAQFLRITDITGSGINWQTVPFCICSEKETKKYLLAEDDILFARMGATTGKTCIIKSPPLSVFASYLIRVKVKKEINPNYLYFFLQSSFYWNQINSNKHNSLKKGVNASVISNIELPLPPLEEQKKIAAVLSLVQKAISQQEKAIALTTELKKALMQKLFTEGTRNEAQKMTEIGVIPESWEVLPFDKFALLQRGKDLPRKQFKSGNVPVIGATQVIGYHNQAFVKAPGVTVVRSGSSAGLPLFIQKDFWAHNVVLYVKKFNGNVPKFVYYKIQNLDLTKYN